MTYLLHDALPIDNEHSPQTDALIFYQDTVGRSYVVVGITDQRYVNMAEAAILPRHILPVPQRMLSIHGDEDDVAIPVFELLKAVLEGDYLGRTDETERRWYEHDEQPGCFKVWRGGAVVAGTDVGTERHICREVLVGIDKH